jgi:hypothetical protein
MINFLGKSLVFIHTLISLLAMTWAAGLFLQFSDWGWKEPHQELDGTKIASEFDKSSAALKQALRGRDLTVPFAAPAYKALIAVEERFPGQHLYYIEELEKLRGAPRPKKPALVEYKENIAVMTVKSPAGPLDKTGLEDKVEGLDKSLVAYRADLETVKEKNVEKEKEYEKVVEKSAEVTYQLTGKDDTGKKTSGNIGLYDLLDAEYQFLTEARKERDELKPIWAETLNEADNYSRRREVLERSLDRLKKAAAAR